MVADIAESFDEIYMREPVGSKTKPTFVLVKHNDRQSGKKNGIAPVYFELRQGVDGNFYIVVTTIPMRDRSLKAATKKDRLIYSSPALGAASTSSSSTVSRPRSDNAGTTKGVRPTSDKSSGSSTSSVAHEQENSKTKVPPMGKPIVGRTGKETTVITDSGKEIRVRYRIVPATKVITSHNAETMEPNAAYPQELQPRDRQRSSMREQVRDMANNLRPADLAEGRNLNQGAPIIRKDGVVLNGNGRAMAIQLAHAMKNAAATAYNKYIAQHAREFGLEPKAHKNAMLVRELVDDVDAETMQDIIGSTTGGSVLGASEQAKNDAKKITSDDFAMQDEMQEAPAKAETPRESLSDVQNANASSMTNEGAENSPAVLSYQKKAQGIVDNFKKHKVNLTDARQELKDLMAKANEERWNRKLTNDECLAAQGFLSDALGKIQKMQAEKRKARKASAKATAETQEPNNDRVFLSDEETFANLEDAFGIKPKAEQQKAVEEMNNDNELLKEATVSEIEALKAQIEKDSKELSKELSKLNANPVANPKIYVLGAKIGIAYIRLGYKKFKPWAAKVIESVGEEIRPWLHSIWNGIANMPKDTKFDEKKYGAAVFYCGNRIENGMTAYDDIAKDFMDRYGEQAYNDNKGYMQAAFVAADARLNPDKYQAQEGEMNHADDSTGGLAERAGKGADTDAVGADDAEGVSGRGSQPEGVQAADEEARPFGSIRVRDGGTVAGGAAGNRTVQAGESVDRAGSTGGPHLSRGVRDSYAGSTRSDADRTAADIRSLKNGRVNAGAAGTQKQAVSKAKQNNTHKAGDLESIRADLPSLRPEQQEDVQFMEQRLAVGDKPGVMLTNGTGTGKTYSGLGLIKRMWDSGKKNILIVAPSEDIINQWIDDAKNVLGNDVEVRKLASTEDKGQEGTISITTYANFQSNKELGVRDWDLVVNDESHNLMNNAEGDPTGAISMLRAITKNPREVRKLFELRHRTEQIRKLEKRIDKLTRQQKDDEGAKAEIDKCKREIWQIYEGMSGEREAFEKEIKKLPEGKRPKVLFLSATPFAYDKDIDYAEGYLFNYPEDTDPGAYHNRTGREQFFIEHFGYKIRYNKLTRPDKEVDSRIMEVQFHDDLVNSGAMRGRQLELDQDYDRGFILVDGGIGKKIDEGFEWLQEHRDKYGDLLDYLQKKFDRRQRKYLLESIKAQQAIPLIKQYIKQGKKVVLFHKSMVEHDNTHPFQVDLTRIAEDSPARQQWETFQHERPDLVELSLGNIPAPMETLRNALGKNAAYVDGQTSKADRQNGIDKFNDDNSGLNVIVCQQDAANAGISLHDTTGKHSRVLINIAMPERPSYAMQIEGRIYRVGNATNAIFRYLSTGTNIEKDMFADTIGGRAESVENLAMGNAARGLHDSFRELYMETMDGSWTRRLPGAEGEGTGGKEMDHAATNAVSEYDRAKSFYYGREKKNSRTKAQEGKDYYATPEPIGYKMVQWLGLKPNEKALEPSAGHGAISRWFPSNVESTIVEPSSTLMPIAKMHTPDAKAVQDGFENLNIVNKYDGIAMNPPYGTGGATAMKHLQKAIKHLRNGGRVVAIIPEGPAADKRFDSMMENTDGAVQVAQVHLPSVAFSRAGTKVGTCIVVIDRFTNKEQEQAAYAEYAGGRDIDLRDIDDINELFDRLEDMTMPDRMSGNSIAPSTNNAASNFVADTFEHTKSHEELPRVRAKKYLGDDFGRVNKIAKQHDGYYSRYAKGFLFKDDVGRNAFIEEADKELNGVPEPETHYSAEEQLAADSKAWKETLREAWKGSMPDSTMLPVMQTPTALQLIGAPDYPIVMRQSKLMKIKKDHPEMTKAILKQLPSYLADPMIIFKSSTVPGRFVVGLELKDTTGINVVVPLELNAKSGRIDVNVLTSAYGRGEKNHTQIQYSWFLDNIVDGNAVYVNKKQVADFYQSAGLQLPMEGRRFNDLFGSSIKTDADLVKAKNENPEHYFADEQQKEQARGLSDIKQEVAEAFPHAQNIQDDGRSISFTMPNGAEIRIEIVPSIEVDSEGASKARKAHGLQANIRVKINGRERTVGQSALIELSQLGRRGTAYHEAFHAVYDMCLTDKEKAVLHKAYDKEAKAQGRDVYEVMADQYRDWMLARQKGRGTRFGKLWQKVKDMAAGLLRVLRRADHASDIFRKAESGKVWERPIRNNTEGTHYAVTNRNVYANTLVPIIDVTNEPKVNVNSNKEAARIAKALQGVTFRIIASRGGGKIETVSQGKHLVHGSQNPERKNETKRKVLSVADKILNHCVYIEKHLDVKHGKDMRYIELFAVVKDGDKLVRFRIVAREGNPNSGEFEIGTARFYDIIKTGESLAYDTNGRKLRGDSPVALSVARLLEGVNDRDGKL